MNVELIRAVENSVSTIGFPIVMCFVFVAVFIWEGRRLSTTFKLGTKSINDALSKASEQSTASIRELVEAGKESRTELMQLIEKTNAAHAATCIRREEVHEKTLEKKDEQMNTLIEKLVDVQIAQQNAILRKESLGKGN